MQIKEWFLDICVHLSSTIILKEVFYSRDINFWPEFVTMRQGIDDLGGLIYQIKMVGILISGSSYIYVDNMSVVHNTSRPESILKKKSNSVCYHAVCKSVAMDKSLVGHIPGKEDDCRSTDKIPLWTKEKVFGLQYSL